MNNSALGHLVDPLREMMERQEWIVAQYREKNSTLVVGHSCDFLPVEIIAAAGALPIGFPPSMLAGGCSAAATGVPGTYDAVVRAAGCCANIDAGGRTVHEFAVPTGHGEEHAAAIAVSMNSLLTALKLPTMESIERDRYIAAIDRYNGLRRLVRGILSLRTMKRDLLSQEDLYAVMAAAVCLPPELVTEHLAALPGRMNSTESGCTAEGVPAVVHSCMIDDAGVLDDMEDAGCVIVEDDTCNGRRQFDLSFSTECADPVREILWAYSFKPLCPTLRPAEERFELFYRLLKSYGIELVVFLRNGSCGAREDEIEFLRKKLMRQGVDPLVVDRENAKEKVARYIARAKG